MRPLSVSGIGVGDRSVSFHTSQTAISDRLRILSLARFVNSRLGDNVVYNSLDEEHIRRVLDVGYAHMQKRRSIGHRRYEPNTN